MGWVKMDPMDFIPLINLHTMLHNDKTKTGSWRVFGDEKEKSSNDSCKVWQIFPLEVSLILLGRNVQAQPGQFTTIFRSLQRCSTWLRSRASPGLIHAKLSNPSGTQSFFPKPTHVSSCYSLGYVQHNPSA